MSEIIDSVVVQTALLIVAVLAGIVAIMNLWDRFAANRWAARKRDTAVKRLWKIAEEFSFLNSLRLDTSRFLAYIANQLVLAGAGVICLLIGSIMLFSASTTVVATFGMTMYFFGAIILARFAVYAPRFANILNFDEYTGSTRKEIDALLQKAGSRGDGLRPWFKVFVENPTDLIRPPDIG